MNRRSQTEAEALERVSGVIGADKAPMSEECKALALRDFIRVAKEYFDLNGAGELKVQKEKEGYAVTLSFHAAHVKTFFCLK